MAGKLFGTDGIRGIANTYPLTVEFCTKLAMVLSRQICTSQKAVLIARDTRISGQMLFNALSAGFLSQGIKIFDAGIIPTPLCTTLTPKYNVDMSIMITASHNPYRDNGLKLINAAGDKFSDEQTNLIEKLMAEPFADNDNQQDIGEIVAINSPEAEYSAKIKKIAPQNALKGMKIVLDAANGSFSKILAPAFEYLGAQIISLADKPDGKNINENCGSQHTENLSQSVIDNRFDMGIAVDGDGDRIIICDENGKRLDGDQIIAYLATYLKNHNLLKGDAVVSTVYSNLGLGKYIRSLGISHYASAVGERYVIEKMREVGSNLGGEESGHMVLSDYAKTGDALYAAIIVSLGIKESSQKVSEIFPVFKPFPCESRNLRFDNKETIEKIMSATQVKDTISQISERLKGHGVILVRKSGTEPVIRLKIEDENEQTASSEMALLEECIKKIS
ncbi:MAG: phosphoglucosamine mutase [Alphaproteobacteria bacterium]|nr:phosphoglucosamine mutase [Alphaproteobacteria bacterium]